MASLCGLLAMILYGLFLGFCYQLFLRKAETVETHWELWILYGVGALICFFMTSLFLYLINGGQWGFYGFLAMVIGFLWYYRRFWKWGGKISEGSFRFALAAHHCLRGIGTLMVKAAVFPFGKVVDKEEQWLVRRKDCFQKKKAAKDKDKSREEPAKDGDIL